MVKTSRRRRRRAMRSPSFCSRQTVPMRAVKTHQRPKPLFCVRQRRARRKNLKNRRCAPLITIVQRYCVSSSHAFHLWHVFLQLEPATAFTVKLRGVPFNVKEVITKGRLALKVIILVRYYSAHFALSDLIFMTATNSRVHDTSEAGSNPNRKEWQWKSNRQDIVLLNDRALGFFRYFSQHMLIFFRICVCGLTLRGTSGSSLEEE